MFAIVEKRLDIDEEFSKERKILTIELEVDLSVTRRGGSHEVK
jgi:hypothetical protein